MEEFQLVGFDRSFVLVKVWEEMHCPVMVSSMVSVNDLRLETRNGVVSARKDLLCLAHSIDLASTCLIAHLVVLHKPMGMQLAGVLLCVG